MVQITPTVQISDHELTWRFVRSGGPGGQNVNKIASKAILRWNLAMNQSLPADVRARLAHQQRGRMTQDGELILSSQRFRDQGRNVEDCLTKLREAVVSALHVPRPRKRTRPSRGAHERRLQAKRHRTAAKQARRSMKDEG